MPGLVKLTQRGINEVSINKFTSEKNIKINNTRPKNSRDRK